MSVETASVVGSSLGGAARSSADGSQQGQTQDENALGQVSNSLELPKSRSPAASDAPDCVRLKSANVAGGATAFSKRDPRIHSTKQKALKGLTLTLHNFYFALSYARSLRVVDVHVKDFASRRSVVAKRKRAFFSVAFASSFKKLLKQAVKRQCAQSSLSPSDQAYYAESLPAQLMWATYAPHAVSGAAAHTP